MEHSAESEAERDGAERAAADEDERDLAVAQLQQGPHRVPRHRARLPRRRRQQQGVRLTQHG